MIHISRHWWASGKVFALREAEMGLPLVIHGQFGRHGIVPGCSWSIWQTWDCPWLFMVNLADMGLPLVVHAHFGRHGTDPGCSWSNWQTWDWPWFMVKLTDMGLPLVVHGQFGRHRIAPGCSWSIWQTWDWPWLFMVKLYQHLKKTGTLIAILPVPGVVGLMVGLIGPVLVYCGWLT